MKTPEEIKRDLIDYMEDASCVTEYGDAHDLIDSVEKGHATMADALAYIQQLEKDNAQKDERIRELEQRFGDAVADLRRSGCLTCMHSDFKHIASICCACRNHSKWECRGVEEEKNEQD